MTYLEIVNNVLRRLREEEVTTVTQSTYSKMVGDFVNDAKKIVENAWEWSQLEQVTTLSTTQGDYTYSLPDSKNRVNIQSVLNDTSNVFLEYRPKVWFDEKLYINEPVNGSPEYYTFDGFDGSQDAQLSLYPVPDGVYSIRVTTVENNGDLSNDSDVLYIPSSPVLHLALALLSRERGETGGTSTPEYFALADKYLSDAIAMDAGKHPDKTIWYTP